MEFGAEIDGSEDFFQVRISNITWYFVFLISPCYPKIICSRYNVKHMFDCPLTGVITIELTLNIEYHYSLLT